MFHNTRLPTNVERGAKGGPRFKTSIIILSSGKEQRNVEWERARGEWDIGYGVQSLDEYTEIVKFFYGRRGRAFGFRFKDWSDYKATESFMGTLVKDQDKIDASEPDHYETRSFRFVKEYNDGFGNGYFRPITRPIIDTLKVFVDGVETTKYTVDSNERGITLDLDDNNWPDGAEVKASFEFDVPVRFDIDSLEVNLEWVNLADIDGINILEIKE